MRLHVLRTLLLLFGSGTVLLTCLPAAHNQTKLRQALIEAEIEVRFLSQENKMSRQSEGCLENTDLIKAQLEKLVLERGKRHLL